jgi:hypothetical protein
MKSNTQSTSSSSQIIDRNESFYVGSTSDVLRQYVDKIFPTLLTFEEKSDLVQKAMTTEPSFIHLEDLIFELYQ